MFQPGDLVDQRYQVLGPLGHGGMAYVFKAQDQHLDRNVALKILRPHLTEADSERFRREIRALAQLRHPGIVSIYDLGLGDEVYFAMELIEGGTFTDLGPLEPDSELLDRFFRGAITVAEALGYVHNLGMVHRDLTPRNILLSNVFHPKVMDFGLVQLTETSRELTKTGFTLGTPQYMAPEQATGDETGAATDLYAFGAVLYRTVTGEVPFEADNDQAVLYQHVYGSLTNPKEINPAISDALSELVVSLLEKDPQGRPSSGYAVAETLRAIYETVRVKATHVALGGPGRTSSFIAGPTSSGALRRQWQIALDAGPQWPAGMSYARGFLFVGLRNDALAVLHPSNGQLHATFPMADEVSTPPLFLRDRLLITSRDGTLQCLDWPSGTVRWRDESADVVGAAPYGDEFIITTGRGTVVRLDLDGEETWSAEVSAAIRTVPAVQQGTVYFVSEDGWFHALEATTGRSKYRAEIGPVVAPTACQGELVLLPERAGALHCFDTTSHEVLWSYDLEGELWSPPVVWHQRLFVASWGQVLHCLSLRTGDDLWTQPLPGQVTAPPVVAAGKVYVATEGGDLLAFEARTGRLLDQLQVAHAAIQAPPLPVGDSLVVATIDGVISSYR